MCGARSIFGVLVLSCLATSCTQYSREAQIADVRKEEVIVLRSDPDRGPVHGISIRGRGSLEGEAQISLMLNGAPYKTEKLIGKVNFSWGGDWYSDTAEIRYEPIRVKSGQLVIEYEFSTTK